MAATKTPIAYDSTAELPGLIGNDVDVIATFESDPKFIDSDPAGREPIELRDTDDTEDSEEEVEEFDHEEEEEDEDEDEEEDDDEDDDEEEDEDEDEDEDLDEEDDEEEFGAVVLRTTGSTNVRGPVKSGKRDVEAELEEMDEVDRNGAESIEEDVEAGVDPDEDGSDNLHVDRAIDAALRMSALAGVAAGFAANAYTLE
jgi:hypothetical protein